MRKANIKIHNAQAGVADRRREPRDQVARPIYVRPADPQIENFEEVLTMKDSSRSGINFVTETATYFQGMQLYVIPGFACVNLEYLAEVVRVEPLPFGDYGIAVKLLRPWNLVPHRTAVMSAFESFAAVDSSLQPVS